ncbi:MAG: RIP metalloprotease RseP [Candidatus Kerfeldbacteria bacterium]|nr:RIP metalloprotease RseP [Candidatus Kerfeldbacteria bacterium]
MFLTIILFLVLLSLLVLVHEFGHFITAKKFGVGVEEFGIGFPPRIAKFVRNGTTYSINALPIGGFVRIKGDIADERDPEKLRAEDSFANKPFWKKTLMLFSGVGMNILFSMVVLTIGFLIGLPQVFDTPPDNGTIEDLGVRVTMIQDGSSASLVNLQPGDQILSVNGTSIQSVEQLQRWIREHPDQQIELAVEHKDTTETLTPRISRNETGEGILGVGLVLSGTVSYPILTAIGLGIQTTFILLWEILKAFALIIVNLFSGISPGENVAGPIGIAVLTGQVASLGFVYLLQFSALLSLNLAIFNLIPFPALDGGRILFAVVEKIRGKALRQQVEGWIHQVGFFILLLLVLVITVRDVRSYSDRILEFFGSIF